MVLADFRSRSFDDKYYQPPQFVNNSANRWDGFREWCLALNQQERFWEAQKIFVILIPVLSPENVEQLFHRYCGGLQHHPRTDATAVAELAATNAYLSSISREIGQHKDQRVLDGALKASLNAKSLLRYLLGENAVMRGRRFQEWQYNLQRLLKQENLASPELSFLGVIRSDNSLKDLLGTATDVQAEKIADSARTRDLTAIQAAALSGSLEGVEWLIRANVDLNAAPAQKGGRTALQAAAEGGHIDIVERLLAAKADINAKPAQEGGRTALQAAAENGYTDVVEMLLAAGAKVNAVPAINGGRTALQAAAEGGHIDIVERLLAAKADINANPAREGGRTALQAAAENGFTDVVEELLAAGAKVNAATTGGRTALQAAAEGGHIDIVERLLEAKADVNARLAIHGGRTALQVAAEAGHIYIVERLLAEKADINAKPGWEEGRTALQAAAKGGHINVVERLLAAGADVDADPGRKGGRTVLQAAAEGGHIDIVERLLAARADPSKAATRADYTEGNRVRKRNIDISQLKDVNSQAVGRYVPSRIPCPVKVSRGRGDNYKEAWEYML
jgi:ankyrin repeat protein